MCFHVGMWLFVYMSATHTTSLSLLSTYFRHRPTDSPKTVESTTFSSLVLELFVSDFWQFECVWFSPWLSFLNITFIALRVVQPAMPVYEKWISPSLHCHGDAQLTRQFCPFKDLHQSCCSNWGGEEECEQRVISPLTQHLKSLISYFILIWHTVVVFWVQCSCVCMFGEIDYHYRTYFIK